MLPVDEGVFRYPEDPGCGIDAHPLCSRLYHMQDELDRLPDSLQESPSSFGKVPATIRTPVDPSLAVVPGIIDRVSC
jgi:hypothetical protein